MTNENNIDKIIEHAVKAQVETKVIEALSDGAFMGQFVQAVLSQKVKTGGYSSKEVSLIDHTLQNAIVESSKAVIGEEIAQLMPEIREEVRKALKKSIGVIADGLVDGFADNMTGKYPRISVRFNNND